MWSGSKSSPTFPGPLPDDPSSDTRNLDEAAPASWDEGQAIEGRILRVDQASSTMLVQSQGRVSEQRVGPGMFPRAGDIVRFSSRLDGEESSTDGLEVLTPYRKQQPFPSPGSETYRLMSDRPSRLECLERRSRCLSSIRQFFDERGYLEVETPRLVRAPGLEPHLRALRAEDGYLITSPEFQMKRLLCGGLSRIYSMGPCWRGDELGGHHLREFTLLEWYRAFATLDSLMAETEALVAQVASQVAGAWLLVFDGKPLDLTPPFPRLTVAEAVQRYASVDIAGVCETGELRKRLVAGGLDLPAEAPFEDLFSQVMVERVEPALALTGRPMFLYNFPAPLAALARICPSDATVAERFELYAGGLELGNAFGELTDPAVQRSRFLGDQDQRRRAGDPIYPLDERFLEALEEGMPPAAGIALGVDRLVMLLCDQPDIRGVVAFAPGEL